MHIPRYYLAYGSNMVLEQMEERCPDAKLVSKEYLEGWTLEFIESPSGTYLNLVTSLFGRTPVFIWDISKDDEVNLDLYEDWPRSYIKKDIRCSKGIAMMYIMHRSHTTKGLPKDSYINPILDVYRKEGYDTTHILNLLKGDSDA